MPYTPQKWASLELPDCFVVVPATDLRPHSFDGFSCECHPMIKVGDADGPFAKPMIVHNSHLDALRIAASMAKICV